MANDQQQRGAILSEGTARQSRLLSALLPESVLVDERRLSDLLILSARFGRLLHFFDLNNTPSGSWEDFFNKDISVLLAEIASVDYQLIDARVQLLVHSTYQESQLENKQQGLKGLFEEVFQLVEQLNDWYQRAKALRKWGEESQVEIQIERIIQAELGAELRRLIKLHEEVVDGELMEGSQTLLDRLEAFDPIWRWSKGLPKGKLLSEEDSRRRQIDQACGKLRQTCKRILLAFSSLVDTAPRLLADSLHKQSDHEPDMGLFIAFLELTGHARNHLNGLTERHLDFYYRDILRQQERPMQPDHTFVCFELAAAFHGCLLPRGTLLLSGVNEKGLESHYATDNDLEITRARIGALKTIFVEKDPNIGIGSSYKLISNVFAAPVANSGDGLGADFLPTDPSWPLLGEEQSDKARTDRRMAHARMGFVLAAPVLHMREGHREITMRFVFTEESLSLLNGLLEDIAANEEAKMDVIFSRLFTNAFDLHLSGDLGWIPVRRYELKLEDQAFVLRFTFAASDPPIALNQPEVLGEQFDTPWPLFRVTLGYEDNIYVYSFLKDLDLARVEIDVSVKGHRSLTMYNELGQIDPSSPFAPFGPMPGRGAYLLFGSTELFTKRLTELAVQLEWKGLPQAEGGFQQHYQAYGMDFDNDRFRVKLSALSEYQFRPQKEQAPVFPLFESEGGAAGMLKEYSTLSIDDPQSLEIVADYDLREMPEYSNQCKSAYFRLALTDPPEAFGHRLYPRLFAEVMAENAKPKPFSIVPGQDVSRPLPNEPYTPFLNQLSVDYQASSTLHMDVLKWRENDAAAEEKVFRLYPFGKKSVFSSGRSASSYFIPRFSEEGFLFIGLENLQPPETLTLFFELQESKKRFSNVPLELQWSYLSRDNWIPLQPEQILADSTAGLTATGIVRLDLPADLSDQNTRLPAGMHWLRLSGSGNLAVVGRAFKVLTQAVAVTWVDNGDSTHLLTERTPIKELVHQRAEVASVSQPVGFFGGRPQESRDEFYVRVSERLRHKNRAVTSWDFERLILDQFSFVQQVRVIGPTTPHAGLRPGQLRVVAIPMLEGRDVEPKVGFNDLQLIRQYIENLATPFADIQVHNPIYEKIKVSCGIRLKPDREKERGRMLVQLHEDVKDFICPWLKGGSMELGGRLSKHELLGFIKDRPYVQFVTRFSTVQVYESYDDFYELEDTARQEKIAEVLTASRPWSVLVPVLQHQITFLDEDVYEPGEITAIEGMRLETDFIVLEGDEEPFVKQLPLSSLEEGEDKEEIFFPDDFTL